MCAWERDWGINVVQYSVRIVDLLTLRFSVPTVPLCKTEELWGHLVSQINCSRISFSAHRGALSAGFEKLFVKAKKKKKDKTIMGKSNDYEAVL